MADLRISAWVSSEWNFEQVHLWGCSETDERFAKDFSLCCSRCLVLLTQKRQQQREAKEAQRRGEEPFLAACTLPLFDHYIIASHAAPTVHSWSNCCACASSSSFRRWCVSDQYVTYQSVTIYTTGGDLVLGHLCYELYPQACQPGGTDGAPHCQFSRYKSMQKLGIHREKMYLLEMYSGVKKYFPFTDFFCLLSCYTFMIQTIKQILVSDKDKTNMEQKTHSRERKMLGQIRRQKTTAVFV